MSVLKKIPHPYGAFREQLESYKEKVGKEKAKSTYLGLVADYKSALLFERQKEC